MISVTDMQGKVVYNLDLGNQKGNVKQSINVLDWPKGIYLLHTQINEDIVTSKLIVQ